MQSGCAYCWLSKAIELQGHEGGPRDACMAMGQSTVLDIEF